MSMISARKKIWSWTKRILKFSVFFLITLLLVGSIYGKLTQSSFVKKYPAPGKMVDVGGHKLHLNCSGEGDSTVIFESGGGSWSHDWHAVQAGAEKFARVCSYDRSGFGWSETAESPRDFNNMVADLNQLLIKSGEEGPYIFVGASLGGAVVQMYAQQYPENVVGMLLLDARGKGQMSMLDLNPDLMPSVTTQKIVKVISDTGIVSPVLSLLGIKNILKPFHPNFDQYDQSVQDIYLDATVLSNNLQASLVEALMDAQSEEQTYSIESLGDLPLIVITHGKENRFDGLEMDDEKRAEIEAYWQGLQKELVTLSSQGELVVAKKSGHLIQFDQPELVINAIKKLINQTVVK